jgi:hypothetical protein
VSFRALDALTCPGTIPLRSVEDPERGVRGALRIPLGIRVVSDTVLQRVASGDADAVEECLRTYGGLVWSVARRFCPNYADAEDAVQDVFIEIWRTQANCRDSSVPTVMLPIRSAPSRWAAGLPA